MKGKLVKGIGQTAVSALLCCAGLAWAQMTPQQHQQYLNQVGQYYEQQNGSRGGASQGPSAAEIRAWEEREAEIQARIARHKATPYWMAIAFDFPDNRLLPRGGFYTKERAQQEALAQCRTDNCHIFAFFANACAVLTFPEQGVRTVNDLFVGIDSDDHRAAEKSIQACEAVHGTGNCLYSQVQTQNGTAFCSGYDYSIYGHE